MNIPEHIINNVAFQTERIGNEFIEVALELKRPSAIYRPTLSIDGDMWCALYGGDLQSGVAGFGKSPRDAMWKFDQAWEAKLK